MEFLTLITNKLRQIPDFKIIRDQRSNSILAYSEKLNQIVYVKYSQRKHPISKNLAKNYIIHSIHEIRRVFPEKSRGMYVLNVFVADNLLNTCFDLKPQPSHYRFNIFNMIFSTKYLSSEDIVFTIFRTLSKKFSNWNNKSGKNVKQPYGDMKERIEFIEKVINVCDMVAWHTKNQKGKG